MPATAIALEETARRVARYQWMESSLFEIMGQWVATVPEHSVKVALSAHAQQHGWHAALWRERLPAVALPDHTGPDHTGPDHTGPDHTGPDKQEPDGGHLVPVMNALAEPRGREQTVEKLVGLYRVFVPRAVMAYSRHLARTSAISDGPVIRALNLVLNDEIEEWRQGEELLQELLASAEDASRAAAHHGRLEAMLVSSDLDGPWDAYADGPSQLL